MIDDMAKSRLGSVRSSVNHHRSMGIRLDVPTAYRQQWCWRDDWVQGGESIYGLLALFEALNVVTGRQLRSEFIEDTTPKSTRYVRAPLIDLRSPTGFHLARLASATHLPLSVLRSSFLTEMFPVSGWRGLTHLRWCGHCAKSGYHSSLFQLPFVYSCPAHRCVLAQRCPRCRSALPYSLSTSDSIPLFTCPACKLDLMSGVRSGDRRVIPPDHIGQLVDQLSKMQFCDSLPTMVAKALQVNQNTAMSAVIVSPPSATLKGSDYTGFVTQVLASLSTAPQADWNRREPSCSFAETRTRVRRKGSKPAHSTSTGWPAHVISTSDKRLGRAAALYRCIRRHVWRTVVHPHQRCVNAACRHMWWPIIGSQTPRLCSTAMAFMRWRLKWESTIRLTDLMAQSTAAPLGLVTWLAEAPVGLAFWTEAVQSWLIDHVLGRELLDTFDEMLAEELAQPPNGVVSWTREWPTPESHCCWVCAGQGTCSRPARLFFDERRGPRERTVLLGGGAHFSKALTTISSVEH